MEASNVPWKVYPNAPNGNDPKAKELNKHYNSDPENVFGNGDLIRYAFILNLI